MATEAFVIAITTQGTREVQRDLQSIGEKGADAAKKIETGFATFARSMSSLAPASRQLFDELGYRGGVATKALAGMVNQIVGVRTSFLSAADSAAVFQREFAGIEGKMTVLNGREFGALVNNLVGVKTNFLSAADSAAVFQREFAGIEGKMTVLNGREFGALVNHLTGVKTSFLSAAESAKAFGAALPSAMTVERLTAQQFQNRVNQFYGVNSPIKSAKDSFGVFAAAGLAPIPEPEPGGGVGGGRGGVPSRKVLDDSAEGADKATRSFDALASSLRTMRNVLVTVSFIRAISGITEGVSEMQQLTNLLTTITDGLEDNHNAFQALGRAANEVRVSLTSFTQLFTNLERSTAGYNLTAEDAIKTTQSFMASFAVSGLDDTSIRNVTRDLKEVFNLGTVQGRVFRSIVMQDQEASLVLSKYIVATGQNAAAVNEQLENMRAKGQQPNIYEMVLNQADKGAFTGGDIQRAFLAGWREELDKMNKTALTAGQGFIILHNDWLLFLESVNNSTGVLNNVGQALLYVGQNMQGLVEVVGVLAAAIVSRLVVVALAQWLFTIVSAGQAAVATLTNLVAGLSTLSSLGVGVVALYAAFDLVPKAISDVMSPLKSVTDLFKGWELDLADFPAIVSASFQTIVDDFPTVTRVLSDTWTALMNGMENKLAEFGNTFTDVLGGAAIGAVLGGPLGAILGAGAGDVVAQLSGRKGAFATNRPTTGASKADLDKLKTDLEVNAGAAVLAAHGLGPQPGPLNINGSPGQPPETDVESTIQAHEAALDRLQGLFARFGGPVDKLNKDLTDMSKLLVDLSTSKNGKPPALSGEEIAGMFQEAGGFANVITGMQRAVVGLKNDDQDLVDTQQILSDLWAKGGASIEEYTSKVAALNAEYARLHPNDFVAAQQVITDSLSKQFDATNILKSVESARSFDTNRQASVERLMFLNMARLNGSISEDAYWGQASGLLKSVPGVGSAVQLGTAPPSAESLTSVQAGVVAKANQGEVVSAQMQALNDLVAQYPQYADKAALATQDLEIEFLRTKTDALSGFQLGMVETQKTMNDFAATAANTVTNAFQRLENTLVTFFSTGKINVKSFVDSIIADLMRLAVQETIMAPLARGLGLVGGGGLGSASSGGGISGGLGLLGLASLGGFSGGGALDAGTVDAAGNVTMAAGGSSFFSGIGSAASSAFGSAESFLGSIGTMLGFASGGSFDVGGSGGIDSQIVQFKATPGEHVSVGQNGGGGSPTIQIIDQRSAGAPVSTQSTTGPDGRQFLRVLIRDEVSAGLNSGAYDRQLQNSFGLMRQGVPR